jgi:hypothetical protein
MSDFKLRPGTFLPFLEYTNKNKRTRPSPLTLLEILSGQPRQSLPLFDLQTRSGMQPSPVWRVAEKPPERRVHRVRRRGSRANGQAD